jgi:hypothetical protein
MGDGVVGLDKLSRQGARVAADGIARWRREDAVYLSVKLHMRVEQDSAAIGARLAVSTAMRRLLTTWQLQCNRSVANGSEPVNRI